MVTMIFGICGLIAGAFTILLPETNNVPLCETLEDVIQRGKGKPKNNFSEIYGGLKNEHYKNDENDVNLSTNDTRISTNIRNDSLGYINKDVLSSDTSYVNIEKEGSLTRPSKAEQELTFLKQGFHYQRSLSNLEKSGSLCMGVSSKKTQYNSKVDNEDVYYKVNEDIVHYQRSSSLTFDHSELSNQEELTRQRQHSIKNVKEDRKWETK